MTKSLKRKNEWFVVTQSRPPLVVSTCIKTVGHRCFGFPAPAAIVNWKETFAEILAGMSVGLIVGVVLCIILVPVIFWPGRFSHTSLYDRIGNPGWMGWVFAAIVFSAASIGAGTARVSVRNNFQVESSKNLTQAEKPAKPSR